MWTHGLKGVTTPRTPACRDRQLELVPDVIQAFTSSLYEANLKSGQILATASHEKN